MRDHDPIVIDQFNGLYQRGDEEETPLDHFSDCNNIRFIGTSGFGSRFGIDHHQNVVSPLGNVTRIYNYITQDGSTLLALTWDGTTGRIYHVVDSTTIYGPILQITGMTDFGFVPYAGRAYITPFATYVQGGLNVEKGMQNEFLYVYLGAGVAARPAGGATPAGTLAVSTGAAGFTDAGFHLFAVVGETDTGYLSAPFAFTTFTTGANNSVSFSSIPIFTGSEWVKRHIVASKIVNDYNGNTTGYTYYFIPNATIPDNTTTTLPNQSFFDADLLSDASHLLDNYSSIPAGVGLCIYHSRMCLYTTYDDISLILVSAKGEPEAFSQIDGLLIVPLDGNPITNAQEMRDILYAFKRVRTVGFVDNDDVPSSWPMTVVDAAIGCGVHGIATVIDSGSSTTDYLIVGSFSGVFLFNGKYSQPELSWKIRDFWFLLNRDDWRLLSIVNDPINKILYFTLPTYKMLIGDYANGMDTKKIRWAPWEFDVKINAIALVNINDLILAAEGILL